MTTHRDHSPHSELTTTCISQNLQLSAHGTAHEGAPGCSNRPENQVISGFFFAEDGGFEPPRAFTQHAFQACAIGH